MTQENSILKKSYTQRTNGLYFSSFNRNKQQKELQINNKQ